MKGYGGVGGSPAAGDEDGLAVISGAGGGFTGSDGRRRKKMDLSSFLLPLSCCAVSPPLPLLIPPIIYSVLPLYFLFTCPSLPVSSSFQQSCDWRTSSDHIWPCSPPPLLSPPLLHSSTLHPFSSPSTSFPPVLSSAPSLFSLSFPPLSSCPFLYSFPYFHPLLLLLSSLLSPSPPCFPLILLSQLQCSNRFVEVSNHFFYYYFLLL